jgi:hypothetical protein
MSVGREPFDHLAGILADAGGLWREVRAVNQNLQYDAPYRSRAPQAARLLPRNAQTENIVATGGPPLSDCFPTESARHSYSLDDTHKSVVFAKVTECKILTSHDFL